MNDFTSISIRQIFSGGFFHWFVPHYNKLFTGLSERELRGEWRIRHQRIQKERRGFVEEVRERANISSKLRGPDARLVRLGKH